jgi:hypothetical protein
MSKNEQAAKSFAEEGLEQITEDTAQAESMVPVNAAPVAEDDGELVQIGGLEPVAYFCQFKPPKPGKTPKQPIRVLVKGDVIEGRLERSFITGKFKNPTYLIRLTTGELVGFPSVGGKDSPRSFRSLMDKVAEGSKVKIIYEGMSPMKSGQYEGNDAHNITLFASKLKA